MHCRQGSPCLLYEWASQKVPNLGNVSKRAIQILKSIPTLDSEALSLLRRSADAASPIYLVGGALRDALMGRPLTDIDLATAAARKTALRLAKIFSGKMVTLDPENLVFRVVLKEGKTIRQIDVAQIQGQDIAEDLQRRDYTLNALALLLTPDLPAKIPVKSLIDPRGGLADLEKKTLRAESDAPLKDDPLRILRAFRLAAQLDLTIEPKTLALISRNRHLVLRPAGERIQSELLMLMSAPGCSRWIRLMDESQVLTALFEDMEPARKCATVYYGEGGVLLHSLDTIARADFLINNLAQVYPDMAPALEAYLAERSTGGVSHRAVLILAALLHDVAKASTARQVEGRLRFFGHDVQGAKTAAAIMRKLRFSGDHIETVSTIIAHHLRPGNLAAGGPVTNKAVYRFFRDIGADTVSLLLVCWADHASYLKEPVMLKLLKFASEDPNTFNMKLVRPAEAQKTIHHLQVIAHLLRCHFSSDRKPVPDRILGGHDVMKALKIKPGPEIGLLLEKVREAQAEGKVKTRQEALLFLSRLKTK